MRNSHAEIDSLVDQRHHPIEQQEQDLDARELAHEALDDRQDMDAPEHFRRGDRQLPARLGRALRGGVLKFGEFGERATALFEVALAGVGERHGSRRASQQTGAEAIFQRGDGAGDGGRRSAQPSRSGRKAALLRDGDEYGDSVETVHDYSDLRNSIVRS